MAAQGGDIIAYMSKRRDNNKFSSEYITSCNGSGETKSRGSHRKPCVSKLSQAMLDAVWLGYAAHFHTKYAAYPKHTILNADETGLYYDMPPGSTLAEIGKSNKVDKSEKHSERLTALLTIRADGKAIKQLLLRPIFQRTLLVIGMPSKQMVDERVWMMYLDNLADLLLDASVLLVDNLECHVSEKAHNGVIEPLPKNSTSRCQPLDVGDH
ncbi:hypothetical protein DYB35_009601 [Aphanomyces astaci]|uniref:DDE-1 domain-containing protein n=1 Tax=Aphanomyces astaci TaxID=112090 RepID=A0A418CKQ6_APHAT|nr:hypothetical protein DYB35_009601 [Aphanomyces astaci]